VVGLDSVDGLTRRVWGTAESPTEQSRSTTARSRQTVEGFGNYGNEWNLSYDGHTRDACAEDDDEPDETSGSQDNGCEEGFNGEERQAPQDSDDPHRGEAHHNGQARGPEVVDDFGPQARRAEDHRRQDDRPQDHRSQDDCCS